MLCRDQGGKASVRCFVRVRVGVSERRFIRCGVRVRVRCFIRVGAAVRVRCGLRLGGETVRVTGTVKVSCQDEGPRAKDMARGKGERQGGGWHCR